MKKLFLAMAVAIVTATAVFAQDSDKEDKIMVSTHQTDKADGYEGNSANRCGIKFNFRLTGVIKVELESVDGLPLAGAATICKDVQGKTAIGDMAHTSTIITYNASNKSGFIPEKDYYISTLPCNLYGGYRLSIYRDGLVAHYFGVHQKVDLGEFISLDDLVESELEFDKPDAPLVEEGRPKMDSKTHNLFVQYRKNPTEANRQAFLDQMCVRYDKVVARKKNKLRELEREARTYSIVEHMQGIVGEMVQNRDTRIQQQFLRFIDPRRDENPKDAWMVLRGASAPNAYIGYAPVTNAEYAAFNPRFAYDAGKENYPVVNITIAEAKAYCDWLTKQDRKHIYRLPSEEEWILGAGHMPKDVAMNANHIESRLTAVDAYKQSTGACGGIDFWGNCWELLDHMIGNGDMAPTIVVSTSYVYGNPVDYYPDADPYCKALPQELVNDLIPIAESRYHTYTESTDIVGIKASREHRAIGGFSMGAVTTWYALEHTLDCFKYFMPISSDSRSLGRFAGMDYPTETAKHFANIVRSSTLPENDFYIWACSGTDDVAYDRIWAQVQAMAQLSDVFSVGNLTFHEQEGARHEFRSLAEYLYNALTFLFPN